VKVNRPDSPWPQILFLVILAIVWTQAIPPVAALGAPLVEFGAAPAAGSTGGQGYFRFSAERGATIRDVLVVSNLTGTARVFRVAPCDGESAVFGGLAFTQNDQPTRKAGSWIALSSSSVTVPPNATARLPFDVRVAPGTASGVHVGGIAVWEPSAAVAATSSAGPLLNTTVVTVTRIVVPVWVTTPGPAVPAIGIDGVGVQARPDGMYLIVGLASNGTTPASGEGTITVAGEGFRKTFSLMTMVPESSTGYPIGWKVGPAAGTYRADVELRYGDGARVARWSGPFTVAAADVAQEGDRVPGLQRDRLNWALLLSALAATGVALLVVLGILVWVLRRRAGPSAGP
jgi:hypothetical protein